MAVADINSLTKPLQSDFVGERGERNYKKPEEKDHFFKWLGKTDLAQGAKDNIVDLFSQERQLESDTGKKIAGSWANIMKALRIDEEDSSGKLLKELQEMEDRGEQSWKALLAYPALGEKLLQKVTGFMIPESSVKAAEKMASGEKYTKGEALMAAAPALEFIPGTAMIPYGKIAKGVATAADELGTAARHFPRYTPFKNIEPKSVGAASVSDTKGKIIQTGNKNTEGTFRYRGKTYNKSDGVLVEFPNVNPETTRTVNRLWTPKESYGKPKDPPRVTKFTKQLDELEPIVKELFPDKNLHTIKKSFIIDALEKKGYTNIGSSTIKNLKERIMKRSPTKEEIKISKFVDDTGRPAEEYAVSTLKGKDYETAQNFIDNISVSGKQKPLLRRHLSRMITQARAKGASDAEITKILKSYDQKKLKEFFKMDEELRKLNKQASDLGINPTVAGKPYAINISHKKPTSLDWKGAFDPDNMFFSDSIGNTIKQRSIEKQIKSLREGVKKLSTLSEKKEFAQKPILGYKDDIPRNIKEAREALEKENLISKFDSTQYGKADPNDPYFKQAMADKIVKRIIEGEFKNGGIVGISHLTRPL
jgi:hypothetical protein